MSLKTFVESVVRFLADVLESGPPCVMCGRPTRLVDEVGEPWCERHDPV